MEVDLSDAFVSVGPDEYPDEYEYVSLRTAYCRAKQRSGSSTGDIDARKEEGGRR